MTSDLCLRALLGPQKSRWSERPGHDSWGELLGEIRVEGTKTRNGTGAVPVTFSMWRSLGVDGARLANAQRAQPAVLGSIGLNELVLSTQPRVLRMQPVSGP